MLKYILSISISVCFSYHLYANTLTGDTSIAKAKYSQAIALGLQKKHKEAIALFTDAISEDTNYVDAYLFRGVSYDELKQENLAQLDYNKAIALDPKKSIAYLYIGNFKKRHGEYGEAISVYTKGLNYFSQSCLLSYARADAYYSIQKYEEAEKDVDNCISLSCAKSNCYILKSEINRQFGKYDISLKALNDLFTKFPESKSGYFERGIVNYNLENYAEARQDFLKHKTYQPDFAKTYFYLGAVELSSSEYQKAIDYFNEYATKAPDVLETYHYRALAKGWLFDYEGKLKDLQLYESKEGAKEEWFYDEKSNALFALGNYQSTIDVITEAIKAKKANIYFYYRRGLSYQLIGQLTKADEDFRKYAAQDENSFEGRISKAFIEMNSKRNRKAIYYLDKAMQHDLSDLQKAELYYLRGTLYYEMKDYEMVLKDFDKAQALDPDIAKKHKDYSLIKVAVLKDERKNQRLDVLNTFIFNYPTAYEGYYDRALYYVSIEKDSLAVSDYQKALELGLKDKNLFVATKEWSSLINLKLYECYGRMKDYKAALKSISVAIEADPSNYFFYSLRANLNNELKADYSIVMSDMDKAISLNTKDWRLYLYRAVYRSTYKGNKENEAICADINKALELGGDAQVKEVRRKLCQ